MIKKWLHLGYIGAESLTGCKELMHLLYVILNNWQVGVTHIENGLTYVERRHADIAVRSRGAEGAAAPPEKSEYVFYFISGRKKSHKRLVKAR